MNGHNHHLHPQSTILERTSHTETLTIQSSERINGKPTMQMNELTKSSDHSVAIDVLGPSGSSTQHVQLTNGHDHEERAKSPSEKNDLKRTQFFESMFEDPLHNPPPVPESSQPHMAITTRTITQKLPSSPSNHHGNSTESNTFNISSFTDTLDSSSYEDHLARKKKKHLDSSDEHDAHKIKYPKCKYFKVAFLASLIIYTLISFIFIHEKEEKWTNVVAQKNLPAFVDLSHSLDLMFPVWKLRAVGPFIPNEYRNLTEYSAVFTIVQLLDDSKGGGGGGGYRIVKQPWAAPIAPRKMIETLNPIEVEHVFQLNKNDAYDHVHRYQLRIDTNSNESLPVTVNMAGFSELSADGIILAAGTLIFLYGLIIFDIVNRTLAAMIGATVAITCLTLIRDVGSIEFCSVLKQFIL